MRMATPVVPRPSGTRTPTGRVSPSPSSTSSRRGAPPIPGMEIPLFGPQPAVCSPAVYRLEENGRAFVLYSKDMHRSHAPLRNISQRAIAPEHPLTRSQSEPQFGPPYFLAHPLGHRQSSSWALRPSSRAQVAEPPPPEPPPPVEFSFAASADDAFRRSIPPPPEPEEPREPPPGFAKASPKWSSVPATSQSHKRHVPLPQLLQDMGYQGASTNRHRQSLERLFSRHEKAMRVTKSADAEMPKEVDIRPTHLTVVRPQTRLRTSPLMFQPKQKQPTVSPKKQLQARNRMTMEREEIAMTRKLVSAPRSLTL